MEEKWQFNQEYLKSCIDRGMIILSKNNLSKRKRKNIKDNIKTFSNFLKNNFDDDETEPNRNISASFKDMENIKQYALNQMKKQYEVLGLKVIDYLIELTDARIFNAIHSWDMTEISLDEQAQLTLENYKNHSEIFMNYANKFLNDPISKIQLVQDLDAASCCYYPYINNHNPLLLIDPTEGPFILNHELQHGIEYILNYHTNKFYEELGPIYFELLFLDLLYEKNGYLLSGDYDLRIDDTESSLFDLSLYFKIMKVFAEDNFEVSLDKFINNFMEYYDLSQESIETYLLDYIDTYAKEIDINYLLSYLKAIELRHISKNISEDKYNTLKPYIKNKKFIYNPSKENFQIYEKYIEEMQQKTKKLTNR